MQRDTRSQIKAFGNAVNVRTPPKRSLQKKKKKKREAAGPLQQDACSDALKRNMNFSSFRAQWGS